MRKEIETLSGTIEKFRSKEFIHDFYIQGDYLKCNDTNEKFKSDEVIINRINRYEGDSNPDDASIIYAITTKSGTQGILIDAFGVYANSRISEFIKRVSVNKTENNHPAQAY
ncbi:MAG TPA: phosphoribosylpyrophosphate synthetase [Ignavibacteria bacterium]|nr:phosphoribosylpyrophosphate synthetase [Ignavibacteria bacterium]